MRGFLAVARREIVERRIVFLAAAAASLLPAAMLLLRVLRGLPASGRGDDFAYFIASLFAITLAPALGWTVIAREISNRRLGFFFSRPLSGLAIWAGKLVGAFAIVLGGVAIILVPGWLISGGPPPPANPELPSLVEVLLAAFVLLLISHWISVAFRSRSALLMLDILLAILVYPLASLIAGVFVFNGALGPYVRTLIPFAGAILLALAASSFASVAFGRTDIRAAHRALSTTFWSISSLAVAFIGIYAFWILSARPADITAVTNAEAAPQGSWLLVSGTTRGRSDYAPIFLWDAVSRHFVRLGPRLGTPVFSRDGRRAAWLQWHHGLLRNRPALDLVMVALDRPRPTPLLTGVSFSHDWEADYSEWPDSFVISPREDRIAEIHKGILSVYDITSGRTLASARISAARSACKFFFLSDDRLRIYATEDTGKPEDAILGETTDILNVFEFDVGSKTLERTGRTEALRKPFPIFADASGQRLLIREGETKRRVSLYDGRTGKTIGTLATAESPDAVRADFLSDGRIVVGEARGGSARVRLYSAEGQEVRIVELGPGRQVFFGGQPSPEHLFAGVGPDTGGARHSPNTTLYLVNLSTGKSHRMGQALYPTVTFPRHLSADPTLLPSPGSPATTLFYGPGDSLVRLDALTGEMKVLLGKTSRR